MRVPNWREVCLHEGILAEPTVEADRLVLWLPGERNGKYLNWERIGTKARAQVTVEAGICAVPAASVRARQRISGLFRRFLSRLANGTAGHTWVLPTGEVAEQCGEHQSDVLFVWPADPAAPLDEICLRSRWPEGGRVQHIGQNLFLVSAVQVEPPASTTSAELPVPPASSPCALRVPAEQRLRLARQGGDPRAIATALTDLGVVILRQEQAVPVVELLEEALPLVRQLGDRSWECDVLGNLGLALLAIGQLGPAQERFQQEHALAHVAGNRFAEKLALDHLGQAADGSADSATALDFSQQALAIARELSDCRHEAELLWAIAIRHAELNQRALALQEGQAAIDLMVRMGRPHATWFADHLRRYRMEEGALPKLPATSPTGPSITFVASSWPLASTPEQVAGGPGLLRMAVSATKAMAAFIGSGFKTVNTTTQQQRFNVCTKCEHHTGLRCRLCGCFIGAKILLPFERCPIGKWPAL